jgi:hypothetical protein
MPSICFIERLPLPFQTPAANTKQAEADAILVVGLFRLLRLSHQTTN